MWRTTLFICLFLTAGCAATAGHEWTRFSDGSLSEWLDREAVPGLTKTFSEHPRFKRETIRIAALDGEQVAGRTDGLTTAVADALHSALMQTAGLNIVRVTGPESCATTPTGGYYLAIETKPSGTRRAEIQLRVFDIVERQWISGFGHQWRGELSSTQRDALRQPIVADSSRGHRVAPFTADQSDLLAERLAADLACHLIRNGDDELIVQPARDRAAALIAGNLAGKHEIPVGAEGAMVLETRVHRVDDSLYQVWAILTPVATSADLAAIAASAYASAPLLKAEVAREPGHTEIVVAKAAESHRTLPQPPVKTAKRLLSPIRVIATADPIDCDKRNALSRPTRDLGEDPVIQPGTCFALEFERQPKTHVYVISHHADAGPVRIYPTRCDRDRLDFGDALVRLPAAPFTWDSRAGVETFHVFAAGSQSATGRLDRLMAQLPDNCRSRRRHNVPAPAWLKIMDATMRRMGDAVAWQSVRVYHQPRAAARRLSDLGAIR
ncbi:MAG: hypothetical protein OER80_10675 [Gammaproteobacteria bacterium]|nr:hypothetical protein [Gammaproteobacteria bacterium]